MRTKVWIITNNPKVVEEYPNAHVVDGDFLGVLLETRDLVHKGYRLITHPLSGSVKPKETNYKSILVGKGDQGLDLDSLSMIENAIMTARKFKKPERQWPNGAKVDDDFQTIDYSLISAGLEALNPTLYDVVS